MSHLVKGSMPRYPRYNALQHDVCVGQGWCGGYANGKPAHVDDYIPEGGLVSADQFIDWLFIAEGYDPMSEPTKALEHRKLLRKLFVKHMGSEIVDASILKWDVE
jgi:hypothetical protein